MSGNNFPYFVPILLIPKDKIKPDPHLEILSKFFWKIEKAKLASGTSDSVKDFFVLRDRIKDKEGSHYLLVIGEKILSTTQIYFGSFHRNIELMKQLGVEIDDDRITKDDIDRYERDFDDSILKNYKKLLRAIKEAYSYVYIPVEIDVQDFTKIEQIEMQKIFDKEIKTEIQKMIKPKDIESINNKLNTFTNDIVKILDNKYFYDTGNSSKKSLTPKDLVEKILEAYFQIRVLNKGVIGDRSAKKISELSSGEKRQALIDLVYAFLKKGNEREKLLIVGIDEPENSLHTSICYDQFEKLKEISDKNQILVTTHWYGFLPVISKGTVHFLKPENQSVKFLTSIDLSQVEYKTVNNPKDFTLKSTNDLVQSIFYSLNADTPYNWLICEGKSDKIYLDYFLKDIILKGHLRIIAVGGVSFVKKYFNYLELPIAENVENLKKGRVFCLTDTDANRYASDIFKQSDKEISKILTIKRLARKSENETTLIDFEKQESQNSINIEQSLNPIIFQKTMVELGVTDNFLITEIVKKDGNTTIENLRNFDIDKYFSSENIKINFAHKYIEVMEGNESPKDFVPGWINQIEVFFPKK